MLKFGGRSKAIDYYNSDSQTYKRTLKSFFAYDRWQHEISDYDLKSLNLDRNELLV